MADIDYSDIPTPGHNCMVCGQDLAHLDKHPSVLEVGREGATAVRRDICPDCWQKLADRKFFGFWLAQREAPKPDLRQSREEHKSALMRLLEQMLTAEDDRFRSHIYVLAHMLMRYRALKWEGTEQDPDGSQWIIFRNVATDETIRVAEIGHEDSDLIAVMRDIEQAAGAESVEQ